jgi:hypothetical protein
MTRSYRPIDPRRIRTYSVKKRHHKAAVKGMASLPQVGASAAELIASLPDFLGAKALRTVAGWVIDAFAHDRPIVAACGAHVIKVGCGPILVDLIERGIVKAVACHGATAIHDAELALFGETSEEVADTIRDGTFGMVAETLGFFVDVVTLAQRESIGLGAAVGRQLIECEAPHASQSAFVAAHRAGIPACVHVAIGTDTVHVAGALEGAALGEASMRDFRLICDVVSDLGARPGAQVGGVWLNIGSAVVMPEVFLKAVSVARNLGADLDCMCTANFDMIRHYRPGQNVVTRPVTKGRGCEVIGHHEIMLPLLRQAVIEGLAAAKRS